jgi:hypothetical protein
MKKEAPIINSLMELIRFNIKKGRKEKFTQKIKDEEKIRAENIGKFHFKYD